MTRLTRALLFGAASVAAAAFTLTIGEPAEAGPYGNGWIADSATHTILYGVGSATEAYHSYMDSERGEEWDPTVVNTVEQTCHLCGSAPFIYVDLSFWAANRPGVGSGAAWCDKAWNGSNDICDHWHVEFDLASEIGDARREYLVCHEGTHTLGLDHNFETVSCLGGSTVRDLDEDHDWDHIWVLYH